MFYVHIIMYLKLQLWGIVQSATCPVRELAYPRVVQLVSEYMGLAVANAHKTH